MQKVRLLVFGLVAAVACGYVALSPAKASGDITCGLGPPPGSSDFATFEARQAAEVRRVGYETVCEANLARFDIGSDLRPLAGVVSKLDFQPVDLTGTPFNAFSSIGALAEEVSGVKSRLYRSFRMPDGHTVTLFEDDLSADGLRMYRDPKDEPERINGFPARLVTLQAPNGKAMSIISWVEHQRSYELWLDANVILEKKKPALLALAASLPKSVPARKDVNQ